MWGESRLLAGWGIVEPLTAMTNIADDFFEARKGYAAGTPCQHKLYGISIGHSFHATEVGDHHRDRTAHANPATHHQPIVREVRLDPLYRLIQSWRRRLAEFL